MSRKGNVQSLESDEFEVAENDDGNLMKQLLQLKMSSETKKSMEHVSNSGDILHKSRIICSIDFKSKWHKVLGQLLTYTFWSYRRGFRGGDDRVFFY